MQNAAPCRQAQTGVDIVPAIRSLDVDSDCLLGVGSRANLAAKALKKELEDEFHSDGYGIVTSSSCVIPSDYIAPYELGNIVIHEQTAEAACGDADFNLVMFVGNSCPIAMLSLAKMLSCPLLIQIDNNRLVHTFLNKMLACLVSNTEKFERSRAEEGAGGGCDLSAAEELWKDMLNETAVSTGISQELRDEDLKNCPFENVVEFAQSGEIAKKIEVAHVHVDMKRTEASKFWEVLRKHGARVKVYNTSYLTDHYVEFPQRMSWCIPPSDVLSGKHYFLESNDAWYIQPNVIYNGVRYRYIVPADAAHNFKLHTSSSSYRTKMQRNAWARAIIPVLENGAGASPNYQPCDGCAKFSAVLRKSIANRVGITFNDEKTSKLIRDMHFNRRKQNKELLVKHRQSCETCGEHVCDYNEGSEPTDIKPNELRACSEQHCEEYRTLEYHYMRKFRPYDLQDFADFSLLGILLEGQTSFLGETESFYTPAS